MGWAEQVESLLGTTVRTFGVESTYEPFGGSPAPVTLIFRDQSLIFEPGTETPSLVATPAAELRASDLLVAPLVKTTVVQDTVVIPVGGVRYVVLSSENDGFGQLTLTLRKKT